jgi:DMSO/TMAO reductase YedYZ molybdopterin-dependent catalytic subunit
MSRDGNEIQFKGGRRRFLGALGSGTVGWWFFRGRGAWSRPMLVPTAIAQEIPRAPLAPIAVEGMEGKEGLTVLSDRPLTAETPVTLLDDEVTPTSRHFIRNNGLLSERARSRDASGWTLTVDGEVESPLTLSLEELKSRYPRREASLVIECAGNGRAGFNPPIAGNQFTLGAVGCARYTGVRLRDVLEDAGLKSSAVFVAYYGEDLSLTGDPNEVPISRGVGLEKALDEHTLLAWEMNGEPLPSQHGFPLRLVASGSPGSASGKWLRRLWVRDRVHDGPKMTGHSYRVPEHPVAPGTPDTEIPESEMKIIEAMPVKSIITSPRTGVEIELGQPLRLRGHAWCGDGSVEAMHVSFDFGATWTPTSLAPPANPFAWQRWEAALELPGRGYYEIWARATDHRGRQQPMVIPGWNPRGYLNNAMQRIAVRVI